MIEICTHCWAGTLPQYAALLRYQLSSLLLYQPKIPTLITVCCCERDQLTMKVLDEFINRTDYEELRLHTVYLSLEELGRRSIGRDVVAKNTTADLVWFADVDMVFRQGCLDALWDEWLIDEARDVEKPAMYWAKDLMIHATHELGDQAIARAKEGDLRLDIDPSEFKPKSYSRAIGGVQIVPGNDCRRLGYLHNHPKWRRPRTDGNLFGDFRDDVVFRTEAQRRGPLKVVKLPELYRLRHTQKTHQ